MTALKRRVGAGRANPYGAHPWRDGRRLDKRVPMDRDGRNTKARPRSARIAIAAFECVALIVGVTLSGVTAQLLQPTQAFALNVQSASFNPTTARNGTALVLTVTTSNDVKCVRVSGDHSATQTNAASASVWTFNLTAGSGDGTKNVTVTAFKTTTCDG